MPLDRPTAFWRARRTALLVAVSAVLGLAFLVASRWTEAPWVRETGAALLGIAAGVLVVALILVVTGLRAGRRR